MTETSTRGVARDMLVSLCGPGSQGLSDFRVVMVGSWGGENVGLGWRFTA